jgi:hypothetical protein
VFSQKRDLPFCLRNVATAAAVGVSLVLISCTSVEAQRMNGAGIRVLGTRPPDAPPVAGQPLETREPIGVGQKPAFPGQTRAVAVISKTPYEEKIVMQGCRRGAAVARPAPAHA